MFGQEKKTKSTFTQNVDIYKTVRKARKKYIKAVIEYNGPLEAPIKKGDKIGILNVFVEEDLYNQYDVISNEDIKLLDDKSKNILKNFLNEYEKISSINKDSIEKIVKDLIKKNNTNFKGVGEPLRIALTGSKFGPGLYDIILSLDKDIVIKRLKAINQNRTCQVRRFISFKIFNYFFKLINLIC